jgi:hypothetical protein
VSDGVARHPDTNLNLLKGLLVPHDDARNHLGRMAVESVGAGLHVLEVLRDQIHEPLVVNVSRGCDDQVSWIESPLVRIKHHLLLECPDGLLGAENRLSQRVIFPEVLREDFMHEIVRIVLVHLDFFQDHAPFSADIFDIKNRIEHEIAQHIHGDW